ncbi:response regulator transcription factor [Bacteroidota bacterium]
MKTKVFYIEDEPFLGKIVRDTLETQGFEVIWETDGGKVMSHFDVFKPEICILDIMLPNVDGYTLCRQIRNLYPKMPIIFLTAKVETNDLVQGFELGGTDYIRKPFSIEELIVRINNQLSLISGNSQKGSESDNEIIIGKYRFIPGRYELHTPEKIIKLSQRDMQVLNILASNKNQVADRKEMLLSIWGDDSFFNSRTLDVYIRKLRGYLQEDPSIEIVTLKGKGYLFTVPKE